MPDERRRRFFRVDRGAAGVNRAVDDELQFHFDMTMEELVAAGMTPDEARREAERRFGDVTRTRERLTQLDRERVGQERRDEWWSGVAQDLRYAVRGVRLRPGFAAVVVLTLGLGIGANAAMFGIVDRLLFRPPAYLIAPERTHHLYFQRVVDGKVFTSPSAQYQRFLDLSQSATTTEVLGAYSTRSLAIGIGENTRELTVGAVSASLWRLFDARPVIGRFFTAEEDRDPGGARVVVLSYSYWQSQYGGAPDLVGKSINIGPAPYTIIGVAPRGFAATQMLAPVAYIPITTAAVDGFGAMWNRYRTTYNITWLEIFARRKPDVTAEAMAADLSAAYRRSYEAQIGIQPRTTPLDVAKPRVALYPVFDQRGPEPSADTKVAKWLLGVAGIVLLVACANVGNLLLGRALRRQREIAVRMALGVRRSRLAAQLLMESMILAVLGAGAGLAFAQWGGRILRATLMPQVDWGTTIADGRILLFAAALALTAGLLAGIAPVFQSSRTDVSAALKAGAREGTGSVRRSRMRTSLLVLQAALSVVLLVGAGLFVRSLRNVSSVDPGYDFKPLVWIEPHLRGTRLDSVQQRTLEQALLDKARENPAVENVTLTLTVPFVMTYSDDVYLPGADSASKLGDFIGQGGSASYFATTGTRIVRGRAFAPEDRSGGPPIAVVSESMAKGLWPNQDALGKCFKEGADTAPCRTVVGVAENVRLGSFAGDENLVYYIPEAQLGANHYTMFVRVRGDVMAASAALRRQLQSVMPGAGYLVVKPMSDVVAPSMRSWRLGATMFAVFGGLALALAAIGLYSVIAYSVAQRTHEMGVRVALGARGNDLVALVMREGLGVVAAGVVFGMIIAVLAGKLVAPLLFDVSPRDPLVFVAVVVVLIGVALAASWIPALRASRVDAAVALRAE
jgi:putative ABC transport system permease protein